MMMMVMKMKKMMTDEAMVASGDRRESSRQRPQGRSADREPVLVIWSL